MTKVPWRTRSKANSNVHEANYPGECVSVNQMESTQAGFGTQLKGHLTTKPYKAATLFVNHYSHLRYIHVMSSLTSKETVKAKQAFERFAADHCVCIKQYQRILQTMHSSNTAANKNKQSLSVDSIASKMISLRPPSTLKETS
ncbi:hypothetical protein ACHAW6_006192 [Cyclotella cf. meneghiniana]